MTTEVREARPVYGMAAALFGGLAVAGVAWLAVLTFSSLDPPEWVRISGAALLPLGIGGALGAGVLGRHGPSRPWTVLGLVLAGAAVVALVVMQLLVGY